MPHDPDPTGAYTPPLADRFAPGEVLAGRYRIVAQLGKGGMGEVYRADDLTLGQPVALKFLPTHVAADPDRLAAFRKEVAAARKVSHPHVCRVYDIADHSGQPFLTMEFVDGEDLTSLLRRVGRVPEEKGVELARQLCGALAAVHDQGLLHRDLKPANVMLDGRGQVRLTDFGLAVAAADAADVRSGTPMYQAPEQLAGKEVAARSDLFALGLVLYELFTGRRAFPAATRDELRRRYESGPPSKPSSHGTALDPAVERVILRCLEPDPANRPRSAAEVLVGLPGGDPLAAAVAAGETPSPQLVAAAPIEGSLHPVVALALFAFIVLGAVGIALLNDRLQVPQLLPADATPDGLDVRAREVTRRLGYPDAADRTGRYGVDRAAVEDWQKSLGPRLPEKGDAPVQPALLYYWYRQGPDRIINPAIPWALAQPGTPGVVWQTYPPLTESGMTLTVLDFRGRLIDFRAVPHPPGPDEPADPAGRSQPGWWGPVLAEAGLAERDLTPAADFAHLPGAYADDRRAWTGPAPDDPRMTLRVEAAAYRGKPVFVHVAPVGGRADRLTPWVETAANQQRRKQGVSAGTVIFLVGTVVGAVFARRNIRQGRANVRGAVRVAAVSGVSYLLFWAMATRHATAPEAEIALLEVVLGRVAFLSGFVGLLYLAFEPAVRRRWPWRVVGWNRLLDGRWRDPLVGRDVLVGGAVAVFGVLVVRVMSVARVAAGEPPEMAFVLPELVHNPAELPALAMVNTLDVTLSWYFVFFLIGRVVRRDWAAAVIVVGVLIALGAANTQVPVWVVVVSAVLVAVVYLTLLLRHGLLTLFFVGIFVNLLIRTPLTLDVGAWYGPVGFGCLVGVAALAGVGAFVAVGNRPVLRGFFGDDE
jgi:serine/threonine-protein kinase